MAIVLPSIPEEITQGLAHLATLFNTDQVLEFLDSMLKEAQGNPLAERFGTERTIGAGLTATAPLSHGKNPLLVGMLTEKKYKRGQLAIVITAMRSDFLALFAQAEAAFLDLKVSQLD